MVINVGAPVNLTAQSDPRALLMLAQSNYHRGTRLNAIKEVSYLQPMIPPKRFDIFPLDGGGDAQKV